MLFKPYDPLEDAAEDCEGRLSWMGGLFVVELRPEPEPEMLAALFCVEVPELDLEPEPELELDLEPELELDPEPEPGGGGGGLVAGVLDGISGGESDVVAEADRGFLRRGGWVSP